MSNVPLPRYARVIIFRRMNGMWIKRTLTLGAAREEGILR